MRLKEFLTKNQNFNIEAVDPKETPEQKILNRRKGIGGSEASSILGLNPFKSSLEIFEEKIGLREPTEETNSRMFFGTLLEDVVRNVYQYWGGTMADTIQNHQEGRKTREVKKPEFVLFSKQYPFMMAHLDGLVRRESGEGLGVLEIKTASKWLLDQYESGIPPYYYIQLQHYLAVTGLEWGELAILVDTSDLYVYTFERNQEIIEKIIEKESVFWTKVENAREKLKNALTLTAEDYVEIDGSEATEEFLKEKYKNPQNEIMVTATEDVLRLVREGMKYRRKREKMEEKERTVWNKIKNEIGNNGGLDCGEYGKIEWKFINRQGKETRMFRVNVKGL